jgi:hypothetical protein
VNSNPIPAIVLQPIILLVPTGGTVYLVIVDHGIEAVRARPVVEASGEEVKEAA